MACTPYLDDMQSRSVFDWISRVIMLVLAGMVSLSIIGSIVAIPAGTIEGRMGMDRPRQPVPDQVEPQAEEPRAEIVEPGTEPQPEAGNAVVSSTQVAVLAPEEPDEQRWLEAITYALLALVGLGAIATLLLWRSLKERRRIADALEAISLAPRT